MSVVIRQEAARDIVELMEYLHARSPSAAVRFAKHLNRAILLLERSPLAGAELGIIADGLSIRSFTLKGFPHHLILHSPLAEGVEIHRVVDGRRDLSTLFPSYG